MTRDDMIARLRTIDACPESLDWIAQTPGEPGDLWAACPRVDWMLWLLDEVAYDERTLRHIACDCAEDVLPIFERQHPDDTRPRDAIVVARRYADGQATEAERAAAWAAAWDAAWAAAWDAADAAGAAAWAAAGVAAGAAAWAAAGVAAGAAAGAAARARQADMIRARVSWADVERSMPREEVSDDEG